MGGPTLTPRLIVRDAAAAITFYREVFGAEEVERYAAPDGRVVHAAIRVDDAVVALADEDPAANNDSPARLGGSPVILTLRCADPDAVAARAVAWGATVVFPVADQFYGHREGRLRDPFGHLWIVSRRIRSLTPEEIQQQVDHAGS